jgi:hypothetical protein
MDKNYGTELREQEVFLKPLVQGEIPVYNFKK